VATPPRPPAYPGPRLGSVDVAARVLELLVERGATLATAESLTGGQLAAAVTAVPGASRAYLGGVVSYATSVKERVLGVPEELVAQYGVISPECALAMARGAVLVTGADWALATTGVAGPDRQEGHPPGTVHVGLVGPEVATALALELVGDRAAIQARTCAEALSALAGMLERATAGRDEPREDQGLG
jgi:nicotinamide-nucleotide amidase